MYVHWIRVVSLGLVWDEIAQKDEKSKFETRFGRL